MLGFVCFVFGRFLACEFFGLPPLRFNKVSGRVNAGRRNPELKMVPALTHIARANSECSSLRVMADHGGANFERTKREHGRNSTVGMRAEGYDRYPEQWA